MIDVSTALKVTTLGQFEIRRSETLLAGGNWNRRKVCELFKLLLSVEHHRLHREQIQEILWPASTIELAANSFGKTLYLLRRALEPELASSKGTPSLYVVLDHDTLLLVPTSMQIDADYFEMLAKQLQAKMRSRPDKQTYYDSLLLDEFDRVLALYGGNYLPDDLYEDWAQKRRDRLLLVHSWLLENAAELAIAHRQGTSACDYLRTLLEHNPADEQTHRQLMLVYARMGRRSEALNQYHILREALKEELRVNPLPETLELLRAIQAGRISPDLAEPQRKDATGILHISSESSGSQKHEAQQSLNGQYVQAITMMENNEGRVDTRVEESHISEVEQSQVDPERILRAKLVGRGEEMQRMQRAYTQTRNGQRRIVFVSGEPGIGKTRLAREFTQWAENQQQATVLWGYCHEMSGSLPYQAIADAIGNHLHIYSSEQLRDILGASAVDLAKIVPELRTMLPDLPAPEPFGPEAERRNLYSAIARYFSALSSERPMMLILDDLQWADLATMQLLNYLTTQTSSHVKHTPFYLLLYRADEVHEAHPLRGLLATHMHLGHVEEIRLRRLPEAAIQELLVDIAGHDVRPAFTSEIYKHTEGNPFFVGEALLVLVQEGKLRKVGDRWQATVALDELALPQGVRLLIEHRLIHLTPECRTTLALAAVLGRQFSSDLLSQASKVSEDVVAEHIDAAIQAQILSTIDAYETSGSSNSTTSSSHPGTYVQDADIIFTHGKIREVLQQSLNPLRYRTLHRQAAQAIETRYASRLQPYYGKLAYHYQMTYDMLHAIDYYLKAAQYAFSLYAFLDAAEYMERAMELLIGEEERPQRANVLQKLADVYLYVGRPDKAIEAGLAACTLWRNLGDVVKEAEVRLDIAFAQHWQGREVAALEAIQRAFACLETQPGETRLLAKAYAQWGMAATIMGDIPTAHEKLQCADKLHAQIGGNDPFIVVVSAWSKSWYAFLAGTTQEMLGHALNGAAFCRASRHFGWEPMLTYSAAWAQMLQGNIVEGEKTARNTLEKAQRHNAIGAQGWANLVLAFLAIHRTQWGEAEVFANKAFEIATLLHDADLQARTLWSRSVCASWRNDWLQAIRHIDEAIEMATREGEVSMIYPHLLVQSAKARFFFGKIEEAQSVLDRAMQLAHDHQYRQLPAIGQRLQGRIIQASGNFDAAQPHFEQALQAFLALDDVVEYARTQEAYGLFYLQKGREGDNECGRQLLEAARKAFERLGING